MAHLIKCMDGSYGWKTFSGITDTQIVILRYAVASFVFLLARGEYKYSDLANQIKLHYDTTSPQVFEAIKILNLASEQLG